MLQKISSPSLKNAWRNIPLQINIFLRFRNLLLVSSKGPVVHTRQVNTVVSIGLF